jgi:hypothetical protein
VGSYESLRVEAAVLAELPADLNWNRLASEMKANIRLGLAAGECVAGYSVGPKRPRFSTMQTAVAYAGLIALVVAGVWMQRPAPHPQQAALVSEGQSELRALAARFAGDDDVTIDLTGSDADDADRLIAFEGSYSEALVERGDRAERREWSERDDVPDGEGSDEFLDEELFPELHDGSSPLAEVQLEWNKPKWARSQQAASAS